MNERFDPYEQLGSPAKELTAEEFFADLEEMKFGDLSYIGEDGTLVSNEQIVAFLRNYAGGQEVPGGFSIAAYIHTGVSEQARADIISKVESLRDEPKLAENYLVAEETTNTHTESVSRFEECDTIENVKEVLDQEPINTSNGTQFTRLVLERGIEAARNEDYENLNNITRKENLRTLVAKLLIKEVENFTQFKNVVQHIDTLENYNQVELLKIIDDAEKAGGYPIDTVTNTYGFRDALIKCINVAK